MQEPMTFGECLTEILRRKHVTVADLARRMNYKSKTSVSRLLRDEVRYASIEDFVNRLEPVSAWLLTDEETAALRQSMEVSRLGRARYRAYRDIWRLVGCPEERRQEAQVCCFGGAQAGTLRQLALGWHEARRLEITIVNSGFESMFGELAALLQKRPEADITIRHYLALQDAPGSMAEQLGAVMHVFHDPRYQGYYRTAGGERWSERSGGDCANIAVVRGETDRGAFTQFIVMLGAEQCLVYQDDKMADVMPFVRQVMESVCRDALTLKTEYPEQELLEGLIVISRRYLKCEQDRSTWCLAPDICFELIPLEILHKVMFDSVLQGVDPQDEKVGELIRIHEERYRNVHNKKKRTVFIFSMDSLRRFAETGCTTDHVAGMRPFTEEERAQILRDVVRRCRENVYLNIHILRQGVAPRGMTLTTHEGLGVYLLDSYTQYDVIKGHSEAFILMPDFAATLEEFFRDELIAKHCHTVGESLDMLESVAEELESK